MILKIAKLMKRQPEIWYHCPKESEKNQTHENWDDGTMIVCILKEFATINFFKDGV